MSYKSIFQAFILLLAVTFTISSCGDDDDDPTPEVMEMDCDDGCPLTTDSFDSASGECVNTVPDCDDNNPITDDSFDEDNCQCTNSFAAGTTNFVFNTDSYTQESVQEAMIIMDEGDTITFGPGTFEFTSTLSVDDKRKVLIIGAGREETTLDFSNQTAGAEGLKITADSTIVAHFTVLNPIGDGIKAKDCNFFSFLSVGAVWDGEATPDNGAYGLYPVTSTHVLMDDCFARGASDAGLYIGQCENVIVRNCVAETNVAGIEIENTKYADVYDNRAFNNTGGLLIFDLPGLPAGQGTNTRAYNNVFENNNFGNFASPGTIVSDVPPGTGIMAMAVNNVEIFDNTVTNNNLMSIGIVDYEVLAFISGAVWDDPEYVSYPRALYVHDNDVTRTSECPTTLNPIGLVLNSFFDDCNTQEILWDGITDPANQSGENSVCVQNSGSIVNADLGNYELGDLDHEVMRDYEGFDCTREPLPPVEVLAPTL